VIDLHNKFKANAPLIAFVPGPLDLTRSDYEDIRTFLEIAPELTGHGLPLSKCEAYNRVYDQFYQSR
jgi:hypothetical protein